MIREFFTILILTYFIDGQEMQSKFLLYNADDCSALMTAVLQPMRSVYQVTDAVCIVTSKISKDYFKPPRRPEPTS